MSRADWPGVIALPCSLIALYLMGLARPEEVPPFVMLRNLQRTGQNDADGKPIFRGEKTVITIYDVIAAMGPRVPAFESAQKQFIPRSSSLLSTARSRHRSCSTLQMTSA